MTTAKTPKAPPGFTLPEPPKSQDEKMTASKHLSLTGGAHFLAQHLGNPNTTIVGADLYLIPVPTTELTSMAGAVYPDLLVAFDADPALTTPKTATSSRSRGNHPTSCWRWPRPPPDGGTPSKSGSSTPSGASWSTGGSTRRVDTTEPDTGRGPAGERPVRAYRD